LGGLVTLGLMGSPVPAQEYSPFFLPEELDVLAAAYDAAWQQLWVSRLTLTADELSVLKKNLAQIILAAACSARDQTD
jgi:hypothetical protein